MLDPQPIQRQTLHEELVGRLRELILDGSLEPGTKIPEKTLCERFGVSRTPMREALKVIAREGLAVLAPNRGAWVSEVTMEEMEEAFPVLGALERLAGEMACTRATESQIAAIRSAHDAMLRHFEAGDRTQYFVANQRIHEGIVAASGNALLAEQHRVLSTLVQRARFQANSFEPRWREAVAEHEEIIAALEARDADRLGPLLYAHLQGKLAAFRRGEETEAAPAAASA